MPALSWPDLRDMLAQHAPQCTTFVETGTFMGETIENVKAHFARVETIEVKTTFYERAVHRFRADAHVTCHLGDSLRMLGDICKTLDSPTCFWLDGHFSSGTTGHGEKMVPLCEELEAIMKHCAQACVIIVDDCRLFGKKADGGGWLDISLERVHEIVAQRCEHHTTHASTFDPADRLVISLRKRDEPQLSESVNA